MNATRSALHTQPHPAPHRERVSPFGIGFAIVAGPLAWSLQLLFNAGIAAHVLSFVALEETWR